MSQTLNINLNNPVYKTIKLLLFFLGKFLKVLMMNDIGFEKGVNKGFTVFISTVRLKTLL